MSKNFLVKFLSLAAAATFVFAGADQAFAGGDRIRLRCNAEGSQDISMDAKFEQRGNRLKFDASFEARAGLGFNAGQALTVIVGGVDVGQMILSDIGDIVGDLDFDTNIERNDNDVPPPGNFPEVGAGTSVVVGPLGCALQND